MSMESVSRLRAVILASLSGRGLQNGEQELFEELMAHRTRLLEVFDVGARNPQQQRDIESGKTTIHGRQVAVNADFAKQAIFLSQSLECSEQYAAELLHDVMNQNPNISPEQCVEAAVAEFHTRRRHLGDSLRFLFEAAEEGSTDSDPPLPRQLFAFVAEALAPTIATKIFREIENIDGLLTRALTAKQNAKSNTVAPSSTGSASLGYDVLNARCDSLKYERRCLASALCALGRLGHITSGCITSLVDWLSKSQVHPMTYYILIAVFSALDPINPETYGGEARRLLALNKELMTHMKKVLAPPTEWRESGLKAVVTLKWTLFLAESRRHNPTLEHADGYQTEELETEVWNAVQGGAFSYLTLAVLHLRGKRGGTSPVSYAYHLTLTPEQEALRDMPPPEFKQVIYMEFEILIHSLVSHASSELRKIKQRQEDLVLASTRGRGSTRYGSDHPVAPRNDIAMLFSFIGLLYLSLPGDRALQFWGSVPQEPHRHVSYQVYEESRTGRLPGFLQWAIWSTHSHDADMSMALYDMLAGLAKGQQCSELVYNFMARGSGEVIPGSSLPSSTNAGSALSWGTLFATLESWASVANTTRSQNQLTTTTAGSGFPTSQAWQQRLPQPTRQVTIGFKEVLLAQAFLRLLSTVATHSVVVRLAISGHTQFRAIPTLVSLIPLGVPLELKGAIFDALSAFCEPGGGTQGVELCKSVWTLMERMEVINVRAVGSLTSGISGGLSSVKGVEVELEEVETVYKMYPATIPFLRLLSTLIHTPKRLSMKDLIADTEPINTVPDALGSPYRLPGIGPFISFVIDHVFAKIPAREYAKPSDRWQMNDLCLCFIERVIASYDLKALLALADDGQVKPESLLPFMVHPGYDVMKRLLTNSALQSSILSYIAEGVEGFEKEFADEEPFFRSTVIRVLRIVDRVLEIQDIFLDVLIPLLSQYTDSSTIVGTVHPRSFFTRFDQALSFGSQYVPALAVYVTYSAHPELVLLSVKIMATLCESTAFTNLTALVEQSSESERILSGYKQILSVDTVEDVIAAEAIVERVTGAGSADEEIDSAPFDQAIQGAALNLLLGSTKQGHQYPNVGHYLLFGSSTAQQIQDPHALGGQQTCIHVILDLINAGIPRLKAAGKSREHALSAIPLFAVAPALAERCYRLVYQLCSHPRTSEFTMRYLRTREDFFARQIKAIPAHMPAFVDDPFIEIAYADGSRVTTTIHALSSFIKLRSWIFEMAALDLHVLTSKSHYKGVMDLLEILYGNETDAHDTFGWENDAFRPFRDAGQSHMRIIEFVQSLNFEWLDSLTVQPVELKFLGNLNLHSCIRKDTSGCEIVDEAALLSLLGNARKALHAQGNVGNPANMEQLNAEVVYIMESCAVENHRREIRFVTGIGYESWRRLLDITLTKCFSRIPHDRRENMLFDLLYVLPQSIRSDIQESTAILLSEAVLSSMTKLREDRHYQVLLHTAGGNDAAGSLPTERLHSIFRSILECIVDNRIDLVRGNLYAAICSYLRFISAAELPSNTPAPLSPQPLAVSVSTSIPSPFSLDDSRSVVSFLPSQSPSSPEQLIKGSLSLVKGICERLVTSIARDAIDGAEVWKTIAFMLLDSLVELSRTEKQHCVLSSLVKHGILSNFVRELKESDLRLQSVLKPDPDDLNPLYVYEAKMSLFIRMAQTRASAERLLEANILSTLAQCDFLDARPDIDESFIDNDSFLPSAIQRYHQLLMPALQLVNSMVATLGQRHATVASLALDFITHHRDTLVILLKSESSEGSLALLEELYLIVTLCSSVLPSVPKSELASSNTGFGSLHAVILSLSSRCLARGYWSQSLPPQNDRELTAANTYASGYDGRNKFDIEVSRNERMLCKAIIAYIGVASDFTEPGITVTLSPIVTVAKGEGQREERSSRFLATIPSIGDAIEALYRTASELADRLKRVADLSAELSNKEHIRIDNFDEIMNEPDATFLQDLDVGQKRSLVSRELIRLRRDARNEATTIREMIEQLLLLLWRHLVHYNSPDFAPPAASTSTFTAAKSFAMRLLSANTSPNDRQQWLDDVIKRAHPAIDKVASIVQEFSESAAASDAHSRNGLAYLDIMCRRLRDCLELDQDDVSADDSARPDAPRMLTF